MGLGVTGVFHPGLSGGQSAAMAKTPLLPSLVSLPQQQQQQPSLSVLSPPSSASPSPAPGSSTSGRVFINPPPPTATTNVHDPHSPSPGGYASSQDSSRRNSSASQRRGGPSDQSAAASSRSRALTPVPVVSRKGYEIGLDLGDFDMLETLGEPSRADSPPAHGNPQFESIAEHVHRLSHRHWHFRPGNPVEVENFADQAGSALSTLLCDESARESDCRALASGRASQLGAKHARSGFSPIYCQHVSASVAWLDFLVLTEGTIVLTQAVHIPR
jgi:hypothetical protein